MKFRKLLLNLYFWPAFVLVNLLAPVVFACMLFYNLLFRRRPLDRLVRIGVSLYGWALIRLVSFMAPVTVEDRSGGIRSPIIFVANHHSSADPYLFGILRREVAFLTTWPFRIPIYKWVMRLARYINAEQGWEKVEEQGEELLATGCDLIIWPEGHRSRDGRLARFRNGAFNLACRTKKPIVPVCILGSDRLLPPGARLLNPARVKMVLLPPIMPDNNLEYRDCVRALRMQAQKAIADELIAHGMTPVNANAPASPHPVAATGRFGHPVAGQCHLS